jgi:hypothetical protein
MPTDHIVALLIQERDKLNRAIDALQGSQKRRGRPPKTASVSVSPSTIPAAPARKKRIITVKQRTAQAKRMRAYWAAKKKAGK